MSRTANRHEGPRFKSRTEQAEYWVIFVPAFALFLVSGCVSRLVPWSATASSVSVAERPSIVKEAWSAADIATSYAFMG